VNELPDLQPIIDRLADAGFATLGGTLDYAAVKKTSPRMPACYVLPAADKAGDASHSNYDRTELNAQISVVIAVRNQQSSQGDARDLLRDYRQLVFNRLQHWTPEQANGPVQYQQGQLTAFDQRDFSAWWTDIYLMEMWT